MFSRSFDNDDQLPKICKPALITHGAADAIVKPDAVQQHKAAMRHAQIQLLPNVGQGCSGTIRLVSMSGCTRFASISDSLATRNRFDSIGGMG
jgi:hypothetical protein